LVRLGPADLEACLALDAASAGGFWSAEQWRRELQEEDRPGLGLRREGVLEAMACGWLILDELHITLVAVDPRRRRLGLGRRVLEGLLHTGSLLGAERATLEVAAGNAAALALYDRCGFRTAGVRRHYYRDGSDALIQLARLQAAVPAAEPISALGGGGPALQEGRFPEDC
jgi:ribosomal-protein-alanine N-acetyltransferase